MFKFISDKNADRGMFLMIITIIYMVNTGKLLGFGYQLKVQFP